MKNRSREHEQVPYAVHVFLFSAEREEEDPHGIGDPAREQPKETTQRNDV